MIINQNWKTHFQYEFAWFRGNICHPEKSALTNSSKRDPDNCLQRRRRKAVDLPSNVSVSSKRRPFGFRSTGLRRRSLTYWPSWALSHPTICSIPSRPGRTGPWIAGRQPRWSSRRMRLLWTESCRWPWTLACRHTGTACRWIMCLENQQRSYYTRFVCSSC